MERERDAGPRAPRLRAVLVSWAAVWPTITVLLLALEGIVGHWPLALRTLLLTGLMVPSMLLILVPALNRLILKGEHRYKERKVQ